VCVQVRGSQVAEDWTCNFNYTLLTAKQTEAVGLVGRSGRATLGSSWMILSV
jgi:hypothetical protein